MLLTADHLAALQELEGTTFASAPMSTSSGRNDAACRALARDGLARHMRGRRYSLTAAGRDAKHLVESMLAGGYLAPREVMAPDWHFIDDEVVASIEAAARDADRVALADAPLLLVRGLAELREAPDELRMDVALAPHAKRWMGLAHRLRNDVESTFGPTLQLGAAATNLEAEAESHLAPV